MKFDMNICKSNTYNWTKNKNETKQIKNQLNVDLMSW